MLKFALSFLAGVFLALSYHPFDLRILAVFSTFIMIFIVMKTEKVKAFIFYLGIFLLAGHAIYLQDYLLVLASKTTVPRLYQPFAFILMIAQIILPALLAGAAAFFVHLKFFSKKNVFIKYVSVLGVFLIIEYISEIQGPLSPVISIGNWLPYTSHFAFWGHELTVLFYFAVMIALFMITEFKTYTKALPALFILVFFVMPILSPKKSKTTKSINAVTINAPMTLDLKAKGLPSNFNHVVDQVRRTTEKNFSQKEVFYFWSEAAFLKLPDNPDFLNLLKARLTKDLPGKHFIGILNFKTMNSQVRAYSEYIYFNTRTGDEKIYQKKSLVPLDEKPHDFPWIPEKFILNPYIVASPPKMEILRVDGINFGIALCNEIMDVREMINQNVYQSADIILNPSNVPALFKNHFEALLDEFSEWGMRISGKPVLRTSSLNYVNWIDTKASFKIQNSPTSIHPLNLTFEVTP